MKRVVIGFSIHRLEVIGITADLMHRHDVICREEPPADGLQEMLQGDLSIDDYLWPAEVENSEFSRRMCHLLRELYQNGKEIIQARHRRKHQLLKWQPEGKCI